MGEKKKKPPKELTESSDRLREDERLVVYVEKGLKPEKKEKKTLEK